MINLSPGTLDRALNDKGCQRLGINPFTPNDLAETHTTLIRENEKMIATFGEDKKEYIAEYIKSLVGN